jgi:hypothetical protein
VLSEVLGSLARIPLELHPRSLRQAARACIAHDQAPLKEVLLRIDGGG